MNKREVTLAFLVGLVIGLLISPIKKGIHVAGNTTNHYNLVEKGTED